MYIVQCGGISSPDIDLKEGVYNRELPVFRDF